jgi:hypothetical protein
MERATPSSSMIRRLWRFEPGGTVTASAGAQFILSRIRIVSSSIPDSLDQSAIVIDLL